MINNQFSAFLTSDTDSFFSLLGEVIADFFALDLSGCENLGIAASDAAGIRLAVIALFIGVIVASFAAVFNKRSHGGFIRTLLACDCTSPERARTLAELGLERSSVIRSAIKGKSVYRGMLFCVEKEEYDKRIARERSVHALRAAESGEKQAPYEPEDYKYDFSTAHFYVPDDLRYEAEFRFRKKGSGLGSAIFVSIASVGLMVATLKLLPMILQFFDGLVGKI